MKKFILGTVAALALTVPANAGSTVAIAGGATASHVGTIAGAATTGPAIAGSFQIGASNNVGAGFAVSTPVGGLSTGIGASQGGSLGTSGGVAAGGGAFITGGAVNQIGVGVGGGFTNSTP